MEYTFLFHDSVKSDRTRSVRSFELSGSDLIGGKDEKYALGVPDAADSSGKREPVFLWWSSTQPSESQVEQTTRAN